MLALGLAFVLACLPRLVRAEDTAAATQDKYSRTIAEAVLEFNRGNWIEARTLFERAYALQPNARAQRGLGVTSYELRHYVDAVRELKAALADQRNPLTENQRSEALSIIERAQRFIGRIRIVTVPEGATVLLDGTRVIMREFETDAGAYH